MRKLLLALALALGALAAPSALVAAETHVSISINVPAYPTLVRVPNYPVYYAPRVRANYFFYDGLYWVFDRGDWYYSDWYNGPWYRIARYEVPVALLHVPVRYYRAAPPEFRVYRVDYAPSWDVYWGPSWVERRGDWRSRSFVSVPLAPLPTYQRQYTGTRYPTLTEQAVLQTRNYRYTPREQAARERFTELRTRASIDGSARQGAGPPAHAKAHGYRAKQEQGVVEQRRGPPDHAPAHGFRAKQEQGVVEQRRGPPDHAPAHGFRAKQEREVVARGRDRDDVARGRDRENPARARDRDADDDHPGRGRGQGKGHAKGHDKDK